MITVTDVHREAATDAGKERFFALLRSLGIDRPRFKVLPVFQIGAGAERGGAYESWQRAETLTNPEPGFFILGAKSYGRNNSFLMRTGWEQVGEVFGLLG